MSLVKTICEALEEDAETIRDLLSVIALKTCDEKPFVVVRDGYCLQETYSYHMVLCPKVWLATIYTERESWIMSIANRADSVSFKTALENELGAVLGTIVALKKLPKE